MTRTRIRPTRAEDRPSILRFISGGGFFRPEEEAVAAEVLDEALAARPGCTYRSFTAVGPEEGSEPTGWICFGPTPGTRGTYDIYWIVVDPARRRQGIGAALIRFAEEAIAAAGGRLVVVETSGVPLYEPTRRFYRAMGYREAARVPDFYDVGDDKVILIRALGSRH